MTIIKGGTATGEAGVTPAHQLLITTINPKAYVNTNSVDIPSSGGFVPVVSAPAGDALIVTTIHLNTIDDPSPGPGLNIVLNIEPAPSCDEGQVGSYLQEVNPGSVGETDIPFNPGLAVPAGDALCALTFNGLDADVSVTGYTVPSSEVPAGPLHRLPARLRPQR
jgi:hypothetical protein